MEHIQLKFIETLKRYTTASVTDCGLIQSINVYPIDHADHKKEHMNMYITYDRLIELQSAAMDKGYLFVY